jgi:glutamate formiminotransferase/formiminotetrahydrofolate cyclodeaminase
VQVSCNLTDVAATPLHRVVGVIRAMAARRGVALEGCELIGLLPRRALLDLAGAVFGTDDEAGT